VPRNAEVIRQWTILREIESARGGVTIQQLADLCHVTTRTIRRDLEALEQAGFPIYDDKSRDDGRSRWRIDGQAFHGFAAGLTVAELCALYFSRTLLESLAATPFRDDLERAFAKLEGGLTPHMRRFVDQLPRVITSKRDPQRRRDNGDPARQRLISALVDASLQQRVTTITYHSAASRRTKTYLVHPYRLEHAQGGLYLRAYVPEYGEVRTFAVERIRRASAGEERFPPPGDLPQEAFPDSLGVYSGEPERVELEFRPDVADYVTSREWHASQKVTRAGDAVRMTLDVCVDRALEGWILSFGPSACVIAPERLKQSISRQLDEARRQYGQD
jgi:predicted DNA-binding transcriptional regulator YafY